MRLPTYELEDGQLRDVVERLLATEHDCLRAASARLQASPGTVKAADLIQGLVA